MVSILDNFNKCGYYLRVWVRYVMVFSLINKWKRIYTKTASQYYFEGRCFNISLKYSNTSQTRGSKLAKFSNSRFQSLLVRPWDLQTRGTFIKHPNSRFLFFLSPKNREFGGITVYRIWGQNLSAIEGFSTILTSAI